MSIYKLLATRPKSIAALAVLSLVLLWPIRQWWLRLGLRDLPTVDVAGLEVGMVEIITEARAAVAAAPRSGRAWGRYGSVLLAQEFVSEAAACFERAEQRSPYEVRWPYLRGLCLERLEPDTALECFRRAAQIAPNLALANVRVGEMLIGRGQLEEAERYLDRAARLGPDDPRLMLNLGRLAFQRGQLDEALRRANQAAELDPQRHRIRSLICQIQQRRGDQAAVDEQLRILETIPETGPGNEWPDPLLGEIAQYKRGTQWALQVAGAQIFAGQLPQAIELLNHAGGPEAQDVRVLVMLGKAYVRSEKLDEAAAVLARALEKDPGYPPLHFELGNLAMVSGRWNEAAEYYRETVRLQPNFASAHYNLGLYHRQRGEREEAIAAFQQACHYMPHNFPAQRELGEELLEAGRRAQAVEHLQTAARLAPGDPKTQQLLERATTNRPVAP